MPCEEAEQAQTELKERHLPSKCALLERSAPHEPQVEKGEVARLSEVALAVVGDLEEAQAGEEAQEMGDKRVGLSLGRPGRGGWLEKAGAGVEAGETMARARDEAEDLGAGVEEVEDLGHEEQAERLGEVAQYADDGEDHAGEVAVGVADEDLGGVPVVAQQRARGADPGQEEVEREEV